MHLLLVGVARVAVHVQDAPAAARVARVRERASHRPICSGDRQMVNRGMPLWYSGHIVPAHKIPFCCIVARHAA